MLNEYEDLEEHLSCFHAVGFERCSPLAAFNSPESLKVSIYAIVAMYIGCYMISWMIMIKLSTKYE